MRVEREAVKELLNCTFLQNLSEVNLKYYTKSNKFYDSWTTSSSKCRNSQSILFLQGIYNCHGGSYAIFHFSKLNTWQEQICQKTCLKYLLPMHFISKSNCAQTIYYIWKGGYYIQPMKIWISAIWGHKKTFSSKR